MKDLLEIQKQGDTFEWQTPNFEIPHNIRSLHMKMVRNIDLIR